MIVRGRKTGHASNEFMAFFQDLRVGKLPQCLCVTIIISRRSIWLLVCLCPGKIPYLKVTSPVFCVVIGQ